MYTRRRKGKKSERGATGSKREKKKKKREIRKKKKKKNKGKPTRVGGGVVAWLRGSDIERFDLEEGGGKIPWSPVSVPVPSD